MTKTAEPDNGLLAAEGFAAAVAEAVCLAGDGPVMVAVWRKSPLEMQLLTRRFPYAEMANAVAVLKQRFGVMVQERAQQQRELELAAEAAKKAAGAPPAPRTEQQESSNAE